jgi:hypothetical protein
MTPTASSLLVVAVASNCLASRRPQFLRRFSLQAMQIGDSPLGMGRRREDCPSIIAEHLQPGLKVGSMIPTGLQFRHDAEIRAEEAAPKLGDQFLACPLAPILGIAAEIPVDPMGRRSPVPLMPISA